MRHRVRVHAAGHQPGDVRHVDHDRRAGRLRDRLDAREVDRPRIGARSHDDHLWLALVRQPFELFVVDPLVVAANAVGDNRIELARKVQRVAVGEVAPMREAHAEDRVARLKQRHVDRHVRLGPGVRLHVGMIGAEQLLGARDRQ